MARKTTEERLAELEEKELQLQAQKRALKAQLSTEERKKRNHRLIIMGGDIEKRIGRKLTDEDIPKFQKYLDKYAGSIKAWLDEDIAAH